MLDAMQQHIAASWPVLSFASATVAPPTNAVYYVQHFPHVRVVHVQLQEYLFGLAISVILPVVLTPYHAPCLCGAFPHPA